MSGKPPLIRSSDPRPRTAVLHQFVGMGDLVWHVPYFRAVAEGSQGGKVAVIAAPTTLARQLLAGESCVSEVIDFDRRPRRSEGRKGGHGGIPGLFRFSAELKARQFDRIVIFSYRANRGLMARLAGIPERIGYGMSWQERMLLSRGPFIEFYRGPSVAVYKHATAFAVAHGFVAEPVRPKLALVPEIVESQRPVLATLPKPLYTFAIGSSERYKQWGPANFARLATILAARGCGIVLLGGPGEAEMARTIINAIPPPGQAAVMAATGNTIQQSAAMLALADANIGNDTGISNLAAALDRPSYVLLGNRPLLDHDPLMRMLLAPAPILPGDRRNESIRRAPPVQVGQITVADVLARLESDNAPGFVCANTVATLPPQAFPPTWVDCSGMRLGDRMACAWWAQRRHERTGQRFGLLDRNATLREAFDLSEFFPSTFMAVSAQDVERDGFVQWNQGPLWLTARNEFARHPVAGHFEHVPQDVLDEAGRLRAQADPTRPRVLVHVLDDAEYNRSRNWNRHDSRALLDGMAAAGMDGVVLNPARNRFLGGYRRLLAEMLAADAFVGGDTGPSHVWALLCPDKPQVAIYPDDVKDERRWATVQKALGLPLPWSSLPLRPAVTVLRMTTSADLRLEIGRFGVRRVKDSRFHAPEVVAALRSALSAPRTPTAPGRAIDPPPHAG